MTVKAIKELFESGKYQEVLKLVQKEEQGQFAFCTEVEKIEYRYYQSRSLERIGKPEEALRVATTARSTFVSLNDKSLALVLVVAQLYALYRLGRLDEAFDVIMEGNTILEPLTAKERQIGASWIALFENIKGNIFWAKGELNMALEFYHRSLTLYETMGEQYYIATSLNNIGAIYHSKGELDTALHYYHRSLTIREIIGNPQHIASSLNNIGWIYRAKGDVNRALEYLQRSLSLYKVIDNPQHIATSLHNIGAIYYVKGELDTALDYYHRSLTIREVIGNPQDIATTLNNIGLVYYSKDELDKALDYLQRSLTLYETGGNDILTSETILQLILLSLDQKKQVQVQAYLTQLQQFQIRTPNKIIHLLSRLAEALVLKRSKRLKEKIQAQNLLEQIVSEEVIDFEYTALAMIHLSDLLIGEVKLHGEPEVWEEAKALIEQLLVKAQNQHSISLICEVLLLQAKFAAIDGKLPQTLKFYEQARLTAAEKNFKLLLQKVETEQKLFETEIEKWRKLIEGSASLQERLKHARMEEYIRDAQIMLNRMKD
ncbi:MAG: tetratricopeptide repeat protein [Candidatus Hermodarchaeota archaeon]